MNKLKFEKSPYLQQHADNPINWLPWCEDAFEIAKKEDKPIFLSIGYSTCHWCHVMAKESFEDEKVAFLINKYFVPIKVDREELREIDSIYLLVCQIMTGTSGWPLSVFLTADKKPFYISTYIPKKSRGKQIGLLDLIGQINLLWKEKRDIINKTAEEVIKILYVISEPDYTNKVELNSDFINFVYESLYNEFDLRNGGFGMAPKFPISHNLKFLIEYYKKTKEEKSIGMVLKTLQSIRLRGIYDQIDGGIHRYSIDEKWIVPHFEKTLYDQALISEIFFDTYEITRENFYLEAAIDILSYVEKRLLDSNGGFYSGEEALEEYYLWNFKELLNIFGKKLKEILAIDEIGNFIDEKTGDKTGKNVLVIQKKDKLKEFLNVRKKLQKIRSSRHKPEVDKKILTDWNSLMSISFLKAYKITSIEKFLQIAKKNLEFLEKFLINNDKIFHRFINGETGIDGYIDDYIFLTEAYLLAYEVNGDSQYLNKALTLFNNTIKYFWDYQNGGFYFIPSFKDPVLIRRKEFFDSIIPSANSKAYNLCKKFYNITKEVKFKKMYFTLKDIFSCYVYSQPKMFTEFLKYLC